MAMKIKRINSCKECPYFESYLTHGIKTSVCNDTRYEPKIINGRDLLHPHIWRDHDINQIQEWCELENDTQQ